MKTPNRVSPRSAKRRPRPLRRASIGGQGQQLEARLLMASDLHYTPLYQNPSNAADVNADNQVNLADLNAIAANLQNGGPRALLANMGPQGEGGENPLFLDANGDNYLTTADLAVVSAVLRQGEPGDPMVLFDVHFKDPNDLSGPDLAFVEIGQEFAVVITVEDTRLFSEIGQAQQGIYSAYADIDYDTSLIDFNTGTISTSPNYEDLNANDNAFIANDGSLDGLIDNAGGSQTNLGAAGPLEAPDNLPKQLWVGNFTATASGTVQFTLRDANEGIVLNRPNPTVLYRDAANPLSSYEVVGQEIVYGGVNSDGVYSIDIVLPAVLAGDDTDNTVTEGDTNHQITPNVRNNDIVSFPAVGPLTIVSVGNNGSTPNDGLTALGGTVTTNGTNIFYTPPSADFFGTDTFQYVVTDALGTDTDVGEVTVIVAPVNDPPNAVDDVVIALPGGTTQFDVIANDWSGNINDPYEDAPGFDPLTIIAIDGTPVAIGATYVFGNGASVLNNGTDLTFDPGPLTNGGFIFNYTIRDTGSLTSSADVDVSIGVNARDDSYVDQPVAFSVQMNSSNNDLYVMGNDTPDETLADILSFTQPANGTVSAGPDGHLIYTPDANYFGEDTFTYVITNGTFTDDALVTVYVNRNPTAQDDTATVAQNTIDYPIDVLANDSDAPDNDFPVVVVTPGGAPVDTPSGNGTIRSDGTTVYYTPDTNYVGPDEFTYVISDGHGGTATATVRVNVTVPPSSLTGVVFGDDNNNGVVDGIEQRIGGVIVTLAGTDVYGTVVNTSVVTNGSGVYTFANVQPGTYTITETDPLLLIDGIDSIGSGGGLGAAGTVVAANDQYQITLVNQVDAVGFNFGERGREAPFISTADFLASTPPAGLTFGLDLIQARTGLGQDLWYAFRGNWSPYVRARLFLDNNFNPATPTAKVTFGQVTLTVWDAADNAFQLTFPYSGAAKPTFPAFHALGFQGQYAVVRFDGHASQWTFLPFAGPEGPDDVDMFFSNLGNDDE